MKKYFDAHVHLQKMTDPKLAVDKAHEAGVSGFICNAAGMDDWKKVADFTAAFPDVYGAVGIHPLAVDELPSRWEDDFYRFLEKNPNLMIGEVGIDRRKETIEAQEHVLKTCFDIAHELGRPVHLHCVRGFDRLLHVLKGQGNKLPPQMLIHSFAGNSQELTSLLGYNIFFSYSYRLFASPKAQVSLKETPLDRVLFESDAPDVLSEPALIPNTVKQAADILKIEEDDFTEIVFQNTERFVKWTD